MVSHLSDSALEGQWFLVLVFLGAPWRAALFGSTKTEKQQGAFGYRLEQGGVWKKSRRYQRGIPAVVEKDCNLPIKCLCQFCAINCLVFAVGGILSGLMLKWFAANPPAIYLFAYAVTPHHIIHFFHFEGANMFVLHSSCNQLSNYSDRSNFLEYI